MKMSKSVVGSVLAVLVVVGVALAADREQFTVTKLLVGSTPTEVTEAMLTSLATGVPSSGATLVSNATLKVYGQKLQIVNGGTVTLPANTIDATMIGTANTLTMISNKFSRVTINGTNYYMLVYP